TAATLARNQPSAGVPTDELDDIPTDARPALSAEIEDPTRVDTHAAPPSDYETSDEHIAAPPGPYAGRDTTQVAVAPAPSKTPPGPSGQVRLDRVRRAPARDDDDDVKDNPTMVMSAVELDDVIPERTDDYDPSDDGWGPPGPTV